MSMLFAGEDESVAVEVGSSRGEVLVAFLKTRRTRMFVRYNVERARDLACAILRVCDLLQGIDWSLDLERQDELERRLDPRRRAILRSKGR
jgi:hypothetical protein